MVGVRGIQRTARVHAKVPVSAFVPHVSVLVKDGSHLADDEVRYDRVLRIHEEPKLVLGSHAFGKHGKPFGNGDRVLLGALVLKVRRQKDGDVLGRNGEKQRFARNINALACDQTLQSVFDNDATARQRDASSCANGSHGVQAERTARNGNVFLCS